MKKKKWILYWRTLKLAKAQPVQRHTVAYIWQMITLCGLLFCLTLLPGCGEQPLQKPNPVQAFAQEAETAGATPESTASDPLIAAETRTPSPPKSNAAPPDATGTKAPDPLAQTQTPNAPALAKNNDAPARTQTPAPSQTPDPPALAQTKASPPVISADSLNTAGLSNKKLSWYIVKNKDHQPTRGAAELDISAYDGYYLGDTSYKYIWLTFDQGYENGYTALILDTLKEKGVHAAFFCVGTYIRDSPDLVKRMVAEGHMVVNHSEYHPSFPDISDQDVLDEIYGAAKRYKDLTGLDMPAFFRPPSGEYSERTMYITKAAGYKTIFWSLAYQDWLVDQQPGKEFAFNTVMDNLHNGEILLLHAVSSSNAEALPDIIDAVKAQGYEFKSLHDLPQ